MMSIRIVTLAVVGCLALSAPLAAWPNLTFATAADIASMDSASPNYLGKSFGLGYAHWINEVSAYSDSARGLVDWFEVGVDGVTTRYYLNEVPEPGSILALAAGLVGFIGLRRRF